MKKEKLLSEWSFCVGIMLIIMMVYLLFVPPYTHKFVVEDIYNSFCLAGTRLAHERWATRADICLWDYFGMSSVEKGHFVSAHYINKAIPNSNFGDYTYYNMMLHKTFFILNSVFGLLFIGTGVFFTLRNNKKVTTFIDTQATKPDRYTREDNIIGLLGFVFSLIGLSFCWISIVGLSLWSIGFMLSFFGGFKSPRIASIAGIIISLLNFALIVILANQLPALF